MVHYKVMVKQDSTGNSSIGIKSRIPDESGVYDIGSDEYGITRPFIGDGSTGAKQDSTGPTR